MAPTVQGLTAEAWQDILSRVDSLRDGVAANLARFADPDEPAKPELTLLQGGAR